MRILQVLHGFPPETTGGTERAVEAWSRAMQDRGHEVTVLAGSLRPGPDGPPAPEDHDGLPVLRLHRSDLFHESWWKAWSPLGSARLGAVLDELRPDVVHVHHWLRLSSDPLRQARARGIATAVTLHDHFAVLAAPVRGLDLIGPQPPPFWFPLGDAERREAFAFFRRDLLAEVGAAQCRFVPCAAHADSLRELGLGPCGDSLVPLPPPLLAMPARAPRPAPAPVLRLLCWGSLYPDKGLQIVLRALREARPAALELRVLGEAHDPAFRQELQRLADGLPVRFDGAFGTADLAAAAAQADLAVLPTLCHESYGLVLDEAQGLGLPVLFADVPAYRSRVPDGCGLAYAPADAAGLAALLARPERLRALLPPPPPMLPDAAASAAVLLEHYQRARRGEGHGPLPGVTVTDAERAARWFRWAERAWWSALQRQPYAVPPADLLP